MATPATRASSTSDPLIIISKAFATHVWPFSFFDRLPFDAAMTTGLMLLGVIIVGAWPKSGFVVAATTPAAVVVCTNSRRLILRRICSSVFFVNQPYLPYPPYLPLVPFQPCLPLLAFLPFLPSRVRRAAFEQRLGLQRLRAVFSAHRVGGLIHRDASVLALGVQTVEAQAEIWLALAVQQPLSDRVLGHALEISQGRAFRMTR